MNDKRYLNYIMPSIKNRSVNEKKDFNFRVEKALQQLEQGEKKNIPLNKEEHKDEIIRYVNEFLSEIMEMDAVDNPKYYPKQTKTRKIEYAKINPENKEDIVWIKFADNGLISVIGTGCDIFFTEKTMKETTSGRINKALGLKWDESIVLIFPLKNMKYGLNRSDIESGIGNYLISKGIPILDFYSHNY